MLTIENTSQRNRPCRLFRETFKFSKQLHRNMHAREGESVLMLQLADCTVKEWVMRKVLKGKPSM
jgi:hypothetical protein